MIQAVGDMDFQGRASVILKQTVFEDTQVRKSVSKSICNPELAQASAVEHLEMMRPDGMPFLLMVPYLESIRIRCGLVVAMLEDSDDLVESIYDLERRAIDYASYQSNGFVRSEDCSQSLTKSLDQAIDHAIRVVSITPPRP